MTIAEQVKEAIRQRYSDIGRKGGSRMTAKKKAHLARLHALNEARREARAKDYTIKNGPVPKFIGCRAKKQKARA